MSHLIIDRLTFYERFKQLNSEWDHLAGSTIHNIFLSHAWLELWWQFFGASFELQILVARDGNELVGIFPLVSHREIFGIHRMMFMGAGKLTPNDLCVLARRDRYEEVLRRFYSYLFDLRSDWDVLDLDKLPGSAPWTEMNQFLSHAEGLKLEHKVSARCPMAVLPESFGMYLQTLGYSTRAGYRRVKRTLERDFPGTSFNRVHTRDELEEVFACLVKYHQERWSRRGYPGAFPNERIQKFHHQFAERALEQGILRMYYLRVSGEVAAVIYCFRVEDTVQYYISAFDSRLAHYSPGMLIVGYAVEQSIIEKARYFDFLEGDESYKLHWANAERENHRLVVFNNNWRGRLAHLFFNLTEEFKSFSLRYIPLGIRRPIWLVFQRWQSG